MSKGIAGLVLVVSLLLGASACGSSDVKQDKFQSELVKKANLTEAQAKCVSDKVYDEFDQADINKLYEAEESKDLPAGTEQKFTKIITDCLTAK